MKYEIVRFVHFEGAKFEAIGALDWVEHSVLDQNFLLILFLVLIVMIGKVII